MLNNYILNFLKKFYKKYLKTDIYLVRVCETSHTRHDTEDIVVDSENIT